MKVAGPGISHLRISLDERFHIGPGRADLLELIDRLGSIAAAGKRMGMSYKRAWNLVQQLNDGFGTPLVQTSRGGSGQGGAVLTDVGREVLERYRGMHHAASRAVSKDVAALQALRVAHAPAVDQALGEADLSPRK